MSAIEQAGRSEVPGNSRGEQRRQGILPSILIDFIYDYNLLLMML